MRHLFPATGSTMSAGAMPPNHVLATKSSKSSEALDLYVLTSVAKADSRRRAYARSTGQSKGSSQAGRDPGCRHRRLQRPHGCRRGGDRPRPEIPSGRHSADGRPARRAQHRYPGGWDSGRVCERCGRGRVCACDPEDDHLGRALFAARRYGEAIDAFRRISRPDFSAHAFLAAAAAMLGDESGVVFDDSRIYGAAAQARSVLALNPKFSVETYLRTLHYLQDGDRDHHREALLKAALPA